MHVNSSVAYYRDALKERLDDLKAHDAVTRALLGAGGQPLGTYDERNKQRDMLASRVAAMAELLVGVLS